MEGTTRRGIYSFSSPAKTDVQKGFRLEILNQINRPGVREQDQAEVNAQSKAQRLFRACSAKLKSRYALGAHIYFSAESALPTCQVDECSLNQRDQPARFRGPPAA